MKLRFLSIIILILFSCTKETFSPTHPMVGKWELRAIVAYVNTVYIGGGFIDNLCEPYNKKNSGDFSVEITPGGRIIYSSRSGTESFRIVKKEERPFTVYYKTVAKQDVIVDYNFTVKNAKGKRFQFKFFYDTVKKGLFGVAWYKGVYYCSPDRPIVGGDHYGGYCNDLPFPGEHLGLFVKI